MQRFRPVFRIFHKFIITLSLLLATFLVSKKSNVLVSLMSLRVLLIITQVEIRYSLYINGYLLMENFGGLNKLIVSLSIWVIVSIIVMFGSNLGDKTYSQVNWLTNLIIVILFLFFTSNNIIIFYLMFEFSLIPIFIMVLGWGYQPERLKAGLRLIFYTLTGSLPLLAIIIYFWFSDAVNVVIIWDAVNILEVWAISAILAFLIKTPMFLVHLWLPKAHVEAPVFGSILLAALLLKLGTYGVLLFSRVMLYSWTGILVISISFSASILVSLICSRLLDIKLVVAYSSVAHMGLVLILLYLGGIYRVQSAVLIIVAHGFRSSGIFLIANILYQRSHSRVLLLNKITLINIPSLALCWFLILAINLAAPPTLNLLAELLMVINLLSQIRILAFGVVLIVLTGSVYTLVLYSSVSQESSLLRGSLMPIRSRELLNIFIYLIPGWLMLLSARIWT